MFPAICQCNTKMYNSDTLQKSAVKHCLLPFALLQYNWSDDYNYKRHLYCTVYPHGSKGWVTGTDESPPKFGC